MLYDLAMVDDRGSYWEVNGVTPNTLSNLDLDANFLKLSAVSSEIIKKAMTDGDAVRIYKPLFAKEVIPTDIKIIKNDESDIQSVQNATIKRVRMLVNPELASVSGLTYYGFMCLNNELADKGFFITEDNREAKYLAILETGDEKMIEKLEQYLNYRDEISRVSALHKRFEELRKNILNEDNSEVITKIANDFMDDYYSRF